MNKKKLYFKTKKKDTLLQGRTQKYIANRIGCSVVWLCRILEGKYSCSKKMASKIVEQTPQKSIDYYFKLK